jgi:phosphomannomutase/phosphoglucomutase
MIPSHIFREYDIRGLADTELTDDVITKLGRAFATAMSRESKKRVAVGYDLRTSSPRLFKALTTGLSEGGMQIFNLGMIPTALSYFSVSHFGYDASICITGSHNPPQYNGFKIHLKDRPFFGTEIQGLLSLIQKNDFVSGKGSIEKVDVVKPYEDYVRGLFKPRRKLKVVLDAGHGMGCMVAPELIKGFGHELIELYTNLDNTFPDHHPDPSEPHNLHDLQEKVKATRADLGIAFDGDADRIGVVDEKGEIIPGDKILLLYARAILKRKPGATVIGDVKCSKAIYDDITKRGGKAIMWKTGHSLIKAKMKETKAEMAGEMSGHMFFVDRWFGFDDAIYAACRMLEIAEEANAPFSTLLADLPRLVSTPEIRVDCPDDLKFQIVKDAVADFKKQYEVIDIDGARIQFPDGWGLVRASNTQPVLVMRFEATSQKRLDEIRRIIEDKISAIRGAH